MIQMQIIPCWGRAERGPSVFLSPECVNNILPYDSSWCLSIRLHSTSGCVLRQVWYSAIDGNRNILSSRPVLIACIVAAVFFMSPFPLMFCTFVNMRPPVECILWNCFLLSSWYVLYSFNHIFQQFSTCWRHTVCLLNYYEFVRNGLKRWHIFLLHVYAGS